MARVLILEPDRQLAVNTQKYLELNQHQVAVHNDLQAAITNTDEQTPDIIVLNLILADRSASEFLYELRSYPDWQAIPVIILGQLPSSDLQNYQPALKELGVKAYLYKPETSLQDLADEIEVQLKVAV